MTTVVVARASDGEPGVLAARATAAGSEECVLVILDAARNQESFHAGTRVIEIRRRSPRGWKDPGVHRAVAGLLRGLTARRFVWRLAVYLERLLAPATGYPRFDVTQIARFFGATEIRALPRPGPPTSS